MEIRLLLLLLLTTAMILKKLLLLLLLLLHRSQTSTRSLRTQTRSSSPTVTSQSLRTFSDAATEFLHLLGDPMLASGTSRKSWLSVSGG